MRQDIVPRAVASLFAVLLLAALAGVVCLVLAYVLVMGAALLRVLVPVAAPQWYLAALVVAALAWSLAFAIYLVIYTPWLLQTRADGKDG